MMRSSRGFTILLGFVVPLLVQLALVLWAGRVRPQPSFWTGLFPIQVAGFAYVMWSLRPRLWLALAGAGAYFLAMLTALTIVGTWAGVYGP